MSSKRALLLSCATGLLACGHHEPASAPPSTVQAAATSPVASKADSPRTQGTPTIADDHKTATFPGGASVRLEHEQSGEHSPVAVIATVAGKSTPILRYEIGDCSGGQFAGLVGSGSQVVLIAGQDSYSSCDEDNDMREDAMIDDRVLCALLSVDASSGAVVVQQRWEEQAPGTPLPAWCEHAQEARYSW